MAATDTRGIERMLHELIRTLGETNKQLREIARAIKKM